MKLPDFIEFEWPNYYVLVIVLLLTSYIFYVKKLHSGTACKKRELTASCKSSRCVKWHKHHTLFDHALARFRQFKVACGEDGLERISPYFEDSEGLFATPLQKPDVLYVPGLRARPLWTDDAFGRELKLLERHWLDILGEYEAVNDPSCWMEKSSERGHWLEYSLYNQGKKVERNCSVCPKTTELIESMSSFLRNNLFSNAMFILLKPGAVVANGYGPCNVRIRCYLGNGVVMLFKFCSCIKFSLDKPLII